MIRCKKCKQQLPDEANFCLMCGQPTKDAAPAPKKRRKTAYRESNSGTIRKLSGNREKPYAAYLPRSMNRKYIGCYATKKEASEALAYAIVKAPKSKRADWTVEDFYNFYIQSSHFLGLKEQTQKSTKSIWKNYMEDIASLPMRDMKTQQWQSCIDSAIEKGKSKSTVGSIRDLASALCKEAMKDDVLNRNYAELLQLGGKAKEKRDIFSKEEIKTLKKHDDDRRVKFILILIYTGMRVSELLEMLNENVHDTYMIGGNKTAAGRNRIIPILPEIKPYIDWFRRDTGTLIHRDGKSMDAKYVRTFWFYPALVELKILTSEEIKPGNTPRITQHFARHTFSTLAAEAGVDKDVIRRVMGHTDYQTTDEHYVELQNKYLYDELCKITKNNKMGENGLQNDKET